MTTLGVGASGATGRLFVEQLLASGQRVKVVVRSAENLPDIISNHKNLSVIEASILDLSDTKMTDTVGDCDAVASCLGHNLSFKRVFGPPRRLLTETTRRLCRARQANQKKSRLNLC